MDQGNRKFLISVFNKEQGCAAGEVFVFRIFNDPVYYTKNPIIEMKGTNR